MKISGRIDGLICGAILFSRATANWAAVAGHHTPESRRKDIAASRFHGSKCRRPRQATDILCRSGSNATVPCLVSLARRLYSTSLPSLPPTGSRRFNHHASPAVKSEDFWRAREPKPSKEELLSFVDQYSHEETVDDHLELVRDPYLRRYAPADGLELTVSNKREDAEFPSRKEVEQVEKADRKILRDLRRAVLIRLRNPLKSSAEEIYDIYRQLPEPRMPYLHGTLRHQLLRALGIAEKRDAQSMLRYFAVIADVKSSGFTLNVAEWNSAISYAARYVGMSTESEAESALNLWREMEQDAGIKGDEVTFNIMFDVASKAGNFTLAEMLYQEMDNRGLPFNRYHHVSLIHFFGLKRDSDGIRAAYKEMVEAGEMVDAVVLNCVIAGLLRSGEEDAANRVYGRMKANHASAPEMPHRSYTTQKAVTLVLMMFARVGKAHRELRPGLQALAPMAPDLSTYRILINHYAVKHGDLQTVSRHLDEMKFFRVPLHGAIFLALFKGFHIHGGYAGSDWSEQRLQSVWEALLQALDGDAAGLYIDTWLAIWALRAFDTCSSPEMVFKAYNILSSRWDLDDADSDVMIGILHGLLKNKTRQVKGLSMLRSQF